MSFGGSVSAMITSLKNNARERKSIYKKQRRPELARARKLPKITKKADPEELKRIALQKTKQNTFKIYGTTLALILILLLLVVWVIYFY